MKPAFKFLSKHNSLQAIKKLKKIRDKLIQMTRRNQLDDNFQENIFKFFQFNFTFTSKVQFQLMQQFQQLNKTTMIYAIIQAFKNEPSLLLYALAGMLYVIYYVVFHYFTVRMEGDYNSKKKNLGKSLPPYPNGWYIACKSKELEAGQTRSVEIAGQNVTVFRSPKGDVYALHSYCAHVGANLGIGGQVVNETCIQCPYHGWLFDGETGTCVDHEKKPLMLKSVEYGDELGAKDCKTASWKHDQGYPKQRKYSVRDLNGFIYLWIHSDSSVQPYFEMINAEKFCQGYANRGRTIHNIKCHIQDIPQNGADIFHFKYVHRYLIGKYKMFEVSWNPQWKTGDDPTLHEIFQHPSKNIKEFKQRVYKDLIMPLSNKQYYSFATVDSYVNLPIIGQTFFFNITIAQMGPAIVNIFLKTHFFQIVFFQYIQPQGKYHHRLYHEMYSSSWLPYWICAIMLYAEGMQVYYDMMVWDAKRVSYKLYYKANEADSFIVKWREWVSQHYQGCESQLASNSTDW